MDKRLIVCALVMLGTHYSLAQQQPPDVNLERISNRIAVIRVKSGDRLIGANMVIYTRSKEQVLVDTNLPHEQLASFIQSQVKLKLGQSELNLKTIFITHWHPDHSGGVEFWRQKSKVVANENVKSTLEKPQKGFGLGKVGAVSEFPPRPIQGLPETTFGDTYSALLNKKNIKAMNLPGHTSGDIVVQFIDEDVLCIGDLVWPDEFPFTDNYNGGNALALLESLREINSLINKETTLVPGHGRSFDKVYLEKYIDMVKGTIKYVNRLKAKGQDLNAIQMKGLSKWKDWASDLVPERVWIEMIFNSL